jgi:hypothetical protein
MTTEETSAPRGRRRVPAVAAPLRPEEPPALIPLPAGVTVWPSSVTDARAKLASASAHLHTCSCEFAERAKFEKELRDSFNFGSPDRVPDIESLTKATLLRERAQARADEARRVVGEATERLRSLERDQAKADYESAVTLIRSNHLKLAPIVTAARALRGALSDLVDRAADIVAELDDEYAEAQRLEAIVQPIEGLVARHVARPTLEHARHVVRVAIAKSANYDTSADGWLDGLPEPAWNDERADGWKAAAAQVKEIDAANTKEEK